MKLIHYKIFSVIFLILFVGSVVFFVQKLGWQSNKKISADEASQKALSYINDSLLKGKMTANLLDIAEDKEKGLYKLRLKIGEQSLESYLTLDGKIFFPEAIDLETAAQIEKNKKGESVAGDFIKLTDQEICRDNGKPIIYFFGSTQCPHCHWEYPVIKEVVAKFGNQISFHDNMEKFTENEVFARYSDGSVPTIVLGCRYYRVGSGEQIGAEKEKEILTQLIQELL